MDTFEQDFAGARFVRCDFTDASIRGSNASGMEIDDSDIPERPFLVNGVDVVPYVESELNRRFPGRALKTAATPASLRAAWAAVEAAWADLLPAAAGREDVSVDGEWSLSQTLRHLVMATNTWLHRAILKQEQPYHALGLPFDGYASMGYDLSPFREPESFDEVLAVRADHQAMVRSFIDTVTADLLAEPREDPWSAGRSMTVLDCLRVIVNEEWEHMRYVVRDLRLG